MRLSTGTFEIQLSATVFEYMRSAGASPFDIGPFGAWAIAGGATPPGNSLVVAGIPEDLAKTEVANALVVGMERTLPEPVRQHVRELQVQHLKKLVRSDVAAAGDRTAPPGVREVQPVSPPEFTPSRCCRVFGAPDLINLIIERGYMNLH